MEAFLIYLLKSIGLLSLFFNFYHFLLRRDSSFDTNRRFLLAGLITSAFLPAIHFTRTIFIEAPSSSLVITEGNLVPAQIPAPGPAISVTQVIFGIYLLGVIFMCGRFLLQFASLYRFRVSGEIRKSGGFRLLETSGETAPFSFLNYIIYNPELHSETELKYILEHEKIHASQWHTADVLLGNLNLIWQWCNPFAWLYLQSLQQNLEFIADREAVRNTASLKEYQKTLLKISVRQPHPVLANNFYQSLIKKRIVMLNKTTSVKHSWKAGLILPVLFAFLLLFNVKTLAQVKERSAADETRSELRISFTVTQNSSREDLEMFKDLMSRYEVEVDFSNLKYDQEGLLTNLQVKFKDRKNDNSGSLSRSDANGIRPFSFYHSPGSGTGFEAATTEVTAGPKTSENLSRLGNDPLIIIGNKSYTTAQLQGKTLEITGKTDVLAPEKAVDTYGSKAGDGALIISEARFIDDLQSELNAMDIKESAVSARYLQVTEGSRPMIITLSKYDDEARMTSASEDAKKAIARDRMLMIRNADSEGGEPLYIVNGKILKEGIPGDLTPAQIDSIRVLKGDRALNVYGAAARNGAIVIRTKNDSAGTLRGASAKKPEKEVIVIREKEQKTHKNAAGNIKKSDTVKKQEIRIRTFTSDGDIDASQRSPNRSVSIIRSEKRDKPLYVVDGIQKGADFDITELDPNNIASINVLKGEAATKKYGDKAANGVIQITTKKPGDESAAAKTTLAIVTAQTGDSELKQIRNRLQLEAGMKLQFEKIKRNENGLISSIKIWGETNDSKASATYEVKEGIPDVHIGLYKNRVMISSAPPER